MVEFISVFESDLSRRDKAESSSHSLSEYFSFLLLDYEHGKADENFTAKKVFRKISVFNHWKS